ncbi:Cysteine--tRNA ligase, cytoplasmic [Thelohanellus kitauei]|uniref:Cysteine--tRNA ligase, cytoplasmic n=1 Tax=Thelohanellus kitauei TaxID=669202 RepID=A0A0C2J660_THEKT|nr:Cysteine--tRNA ligase, cytoplasmic [Thelohanellus kitauei]
MDNQSHPSGEGARLKLYNSLTQSKVEFRPLMPKTVTWYCCGPTVYDSAHMGHARSYITFDIIRRILTNYFNYNVIFVMNITDVDDKIISKARKEHLWTQFLKETVTLDYLKTIIDGSVTSFKTKIENTADPEVKNLYIKRFNDFENKISAMSTEKLFESRESFFEEFKDIICNYLDAVVSLKVFV